MGNDTDTMEVNQQIHVKKKDTGHSLQHEKSEDETTALNDNEGSNDMAVVHSPEEFEDPVNTSSGFYHDNKVVLDKANGTPTSENKGNEDHSDDSDSEPEADNGGVPSADTSITNVQQESTSEYGASRELVKDQATSVTVTPVDPTTKHCVVSNSGESTVIVEDTKVMANNAEIFPLQDDIPEQLPQEPPPPADQLNYQGINPNDENNGVEQEENIDVPVGVPFFMNVDPPQMIMEGSLILPFPPLPENGHHLNDTEETGTEDESSSFSSDILNTDDQVEYLEFR